MIDRVSDLLAKLIDEETRRLNEYNLSHGPTIGEMYEGLTKEILNRAIPSELCLDVVTGFVTDDSRTLSPQIDCMIVRGSGEQIPHTNKYKWHVKDVIAVFEVKKTLYSKELADSYAKLRAVLDNFGRYVTESGRPETFNISSAFQTFEQMTGLKAPKYKNAASLPYEMELIYHSLVLERVSPVRIALGYDGFTTEEAFRKAFYTYLADNIGKHGFGVRSIPQLCISGQFSLVKINGQPYVSPMQDGWWPVVISARVNPVRLLLEFIWTRIERNFGVSGLWGDDLQLEGLNCCLLAKAVDLGDRQGWQYKYISAEEAALSQLPTSIDWEPTTVDEIQYVVFNCLCDGQTVLTTDPEFISYLTSRGLDITTFVAGMVATGLVAVDGERLKLTTEGMACMILPDGRYVVGENNTGRLSRWIQRYMDAKPRQP